MAGFDPNAFGTGLLQGAALVQGVRQQQRQNMLDKHNMELDQSQETRAKESHERSTRSADWQHSENTNARLAGEIAVLATREGGLAGLSPQERARLFGAVSESRQTLPGFNVDEIATAEDGSEILIGSGQRDDGTEFSGKPASVGGGTDDDPLVFGQGEIDEFLMGFAAEYDPATRARLQADTDRKEAVGRFAGLSTAASPPSHGVTPPQGGVQASGQGPDVPAPSGQVTQEQVQGQGAPQTPGQGSPALSTAAWTAPNGRTVAQMPEEFAPLASAAGQRHGLPGAGLAAQAGWESNYKPDAVSPSGDHIGIGQIGKAVADNHGVEHEQVRDPAVAFDVMGAEMARLLDQYNGNLVLALAAYNAGPVKANEWQRRFGDNMTADQITYEETREYVQAILPHYQPGDGLQSAAAPPQAVVPQEEPMAPTQPTAAPPTPQAAVPAHNDGFQAGPETGGMRAVKKVGSAIATGAEYVTGNHPSQKAARWTQVANPNNGSLAHIRDNPGKFVDDYLVDLEHVPEEARRELDANFAFAVEEELNQLNEEFEQFKPGFGEQPAAVREAYGNHKTNDRYQKNRERHRQLVGYQQKLGETAPSMVTEPTPPSQEAATAATERAATVAPRPASNDQLVEAQTSLSQPPGPRGLSPQQIDDAIWLKQHGFLAPGSFERYMTTGELRESELKQFDPTKDLWNVYDDGSRVLVRAGNPEQATTTAQQRLAHTISKDNLKWTEEQLVHYIPYEEGTPQFGQAVASFYSSLEADALGAARRGLDTQAMGTGRNMSRADIGTYMAAWAQQYSKQRAWEGSWWKRQTTSRPTGQPSDLLPDAPADYHAGGNTVDVPGAREAMLNSGDTELVELANQLDDDQLHQYIIEATRQ